MSYADTILLSKVGETFNRKELQKIYIQNGYALGAADKVLEYGILSGTLERIGRGKYQKVDSYKKEILRYHNEGFSNQQISEALKISSVEVDNILSQAKPNSNNQ